MRNQAVFLNVYSSTFRGGIELLASEMLFGIERRKNQTMSISMSLLEWWLKHQGPVSPIVVLVDNLVFILICAI